MKKILLTIALLIIPIAAFAAPPSFSIPLMGTSTSNTLAFPQVVNGTQPTLYTRNIITSSTVDANIFAGNLNVTAPVGLNTFNSTGRFTNGLQMTGGNFTVQPPVGSISSMTTPFKMFDINSDGSQPGISIGTLTNPPLNGLIVVGNAGFGTTTPGTQVSIGNTGGINFVPTATSTFGSSANGINITNGCYAISGACIGNGSGSGTITAVNAGTGLSGGGSSGAVTLNLSTPVSIANGGTNAITNALASDNVGTQSTTTGDSYNNWKTIKPSFSGQILNDTRFNSNFVYGAANSTGTGDWRYPWVFPSGIVAVGTPALAGQDEMAANQNTFTINLNGNFGDRNASGDAALIVENWSHSVNNSGTGVCPADMGFDGASTTVVSTIGTCFATVPWHTAAYDLPANATFVSNTDLANMRGLAISSPLLGLNGFRYPDTGDYSLQYYDYVNGINRFPLIVQGIYQPLDRKFALTVSGVSVYPGFGDTYSIGAANYTVSTAGAGVITMTATTTPPASGTLVRVSGVGDSSISYSAEVQTGQWADGAKYDPFTGIFTLSTSTQSTSTISEQLKLGYVTGSTQCLQANSSGIVSGTGSGCGGGGGTPGGASSTIQYNANGAFAGASPLTTTGTTLDIGTSSYITFNGGSTLMYSASSTIQDAFFDGAGPSNPATIFTTYRGIQNLAIGPSALALSTTSSDNIAIGTGAMQNYVARSDQGNHSIAVGPNSLNGATGAHWDGNDAFGFDSGLLMRNGSYNDLFGGNAGAQMRDGFFNTCVGGSSCLNVRDGSHTTFIGTNSGLINTSLQDSASYSSAIGDTATVGCNNCMVLGGVGATAGVSVGIGTTTPSGSLLAIQGVAGFYQDSLLNISSSTAAFASTTIFVVKANGNVISGNNAVVTNTNTGTTTISNLNFGNMTFDTNAGVVTALDLPITSAAAATTPESYTFNDMGSTTLTIYGQADGGGYVKQGTLGVGIASTSPWRTFDVNGTVGMKGLTVEGGVSGNALCLSGSGSNEVVVNSGATTCLLSSERYKENIKDLNPEQVVSELMALQPSSFDYTQNRKQDMGFVAEQVASVDPRMAAYDAKGNVQSINEQDILAVTVKTVQEQQKEIDALKSEKSGGIPWEISFVLVVLVIWNIRLTLRKK